jgi:hypothetical protein
MKSAMTMRLQLVIDHNCISPKSEEETLVESPFFRWFFSRIWLAITAHNKKGCRSSNTKKKKKNPQNHHHLKTKSHKLNFLFTTATPTISKRKQTERKLLLKLDTKSPILNTTNTTFFFFFFFLLFSTNLFLQQERKLQFQ